MSYTKTLIIILVAALIIFGHYFGNRVLITNLLHSRTATVVQTDTVVEVVKDTVKIVKYVPKYIRVSDTVEIPADVDTAAILKNYYSTFLLRDTIVDDSALFVSITDSITQNQVVARIPIIVRTYPKIIINKTITVTESDNGLFVGGYVGQSFGGQVEYKHNRYIGGIRAGTDGISASISVKLSNKINKLTKYLHFK